MSSGSSQDIFAGELLIEPPKPPRERRVVRRIAAAARSGAIAGVLPTAVVFTLYYAQFAELAMPWFEIGAIAIIYGLACGAFMATLIELAVMLFDVVARVGFGVALVFNPVTAATIMCSLASIIPGAIGVGVFAGYHGPPVPTSYILGGCLALSAMLAVPLARRERAQRKKPPRNRVLGLLAVGAAIPPMLLAVAIAPPLVMALNRSSAEIGGYWVGAEAGVIAGAIEGLYIGLVTLYRYS